ncbi:MalY/PatB family protein [Candidatus Methylopumilus planktonicus]|uniref:MalY/PatB family protein n=1 Tax=Candidatus Methylopumilus planktonicus TaxID=1581557 RepID=UPI003D18F425
MQRFDKTISREASASLKYDGRLETFGTNDVLPMWVADMDFAVPDAVIEALQKRASHPIYGYSIAPESLYQALIEWLLLKHQWPVKREWIVLTPGVVPSLNLVVAALTAENAGVIVQPPVYFPFLSAVESQHRRLIENSLILEEDDLGNLHYQMDLLQLDTCAKEASLLMFCSPHNPVGRVWLKEELLALLAVAKKHSLIILADEIHADLVFTDAQHYTLSRLAFEATPTRSSIDAPHAIITAVSPSKTFNIPGLGLSALIIPDAIYRQTIQSHLAKMAVSVTNPFSMIAFEAAYRGGADWLRELMAYLQTTRDEAVAFIRAHIPKINAVCPQGTYLLWLDCRKLNLDDKALALFFVQEAQLGLSNGAMFGRGGKGFMRLNIGTPRANVMKALDRLKSALS